MPGFKKKQNLQNKYTDIPFKYSNSQIASYRGF